MKSRFTVDITAPIADPQSGNPTLQFHRQINGAFQDIDTALAGLQDQLTAIEAAQAAATAAAAAAATANAAATTAQAAATTANTAAATANNAVAVTNAYPTGLTISATDAGASASISISAHNEVYPQANGTNVTVAVNSGSLTGLAYTTSYWIYYDDPTKAGGAVSYQSTTTQATAAQTGNRIFVGAVTTPAALGAAVPGKFREAPGTVSP